MNKQFFLLILKKFKMAVITMDQAIVKLRKSNKVQ